MALEKFELEDVLLATSKAVGRKGRASFEEDFLNGLLPQGSAAVRGNVTKEADDPRTVQTDVDRMCESAFRDALQSFAGLRVVTEEGGQYAIAGSGFEDYTVVIDDWDGSTNGTKGLNLSGISVALDYRGKPWRGYWYDPYRDYQIFTKDIDSEGFGCIACILETEPIRPSSLLRTPERARALSEARLIVHRGTKSHPISDLHKHPLSTLGEKALAVMNFETSVISLMSVALGTVDCFLVAGNRAWDLWAARSIFKALCVPFAFMEPFTYRVLDEAEITPDPEKEYAFVCANNQVLMDEIMAVLQAKS